MRTHTELVAVTYRRVKAGEREPDHFCDYPIEKPNHENWDWENLPLYDWADKLVAKNERELSAEYRQMVYIDLPEDWHGLSFEFVGQLFDGQELGLSIECANTGVREVFEKWADELRAIGNQLLDEEIARIMLEDYGRNPSKVNGEMPKQVTFLTAWTYTVTVSRDWESNECDTDWKLLGRVDLSNIQSLIVPLSVMQSAPST